MIFFFSYSKFEVRLHLFTMASSTAPGKLGKRPAEELTAAEKASKVQKLIEEAECLMHDIPTPATATSQQEETHGQTTQEMFLTQKTPPRSPSPVEIAETLTYGQQADIAKKEYYEVKKEKAKLGIILCQLQIESERKRHILLEAQMPGGSQSQ